MPVRIVRLGTARLEGEGLRIGTVRRPPRGVPRERFAADDWFDVWLPVVAPSQGLVNEARSGATDAQWKAFVRSYRAEMSKPDPAKVLDLLAALSHTTAISVGCYCADEARCHRSVLRQLLAERGAEIA